MRCPTLLKKPVQVEIDDKSKGFRFGAINSPGPRCAGEPRPVDPKGWAGARVGIGMVLVGGIPLIEKSRSF